MRPCDENRLSVSGRVRGLLLSILLLSMAACPGCYERVVGGSGSAMQGTDTYEPNVDKEKGAFQQFADDVFGDEERSKRK